MSEKNLEEKILEKIKKDKVGMTPKWVFVVNSLLLSLGLILLIVGSALLVNFIFYFLRINGFRGYLPLWLPLVALFLIFSVIKLIKQFDFSYKVNFAVLLISVVLAILAFGLIVDRSGLNTTLSRGRMKGFYQQLQGQKQIQPDNSGGGKRFQKTNR